MKIIDYFIWLQHYSVQFKIFLHAIPHRNQIPKIHTFPHGSAFNVTRLYYTTTHLKYRHIHSGIMKFGKYI